MRMLLLPLPVELCRNVAAKNLSRNMRAFASYQKLALQSLMLCKVSPRSVSRNRWHTPQSLISANFLHIQRFENSEEENRKKTFQKPIHDLNCLNDIVMAKCERPPIYIAKFTRKQDKFECELQLNWPETQTFRASARNKKSAKAEAAHEALLWLYTNNYVNKASKPTFKDAAGNKNQITLDISEAATLKIENVLKIYSEVVAPTITKLLLEQTTTKRAVDEEETYHPTLGIPFPEDEDIEKFSLTLKAKKSQINSTSALPIDSHSKLIVKTMKNHRVTIIRGETGCGKTTKVPQFILDDAIAEGVGGFCNIAVAQPRRLTTMQIAQFVAQERGEKIGEYVGYSVKMESKLPQVIGGSITFFTGMKLAQKFITNPSLNGVSHVILDEIHLRDIATDLLMTLLKAAMIRNQNLRVILMSATTSTDLFQSYFSCFGEVAVVEVPGRTFPVKMHFLNDLPPNIAKEAYFNPILGVDYELVYRVVTWIDRTKPPGAILIFVSGWSDMLQLQKSFKNNTNLCIIPVHSMVKNCSPAFQEAPKGKRKVLLATNIAETSVTFPDVVFVVDCGLHKKPQRDFLSPGGWASSSISTHAITKANVLQRKGRAGRVQPGESFHLFTKKMFDVMEDFESPSILLESLEYLVLSMKIMNPNINAAALLSEFPTPPNMKDVRNAVSTLQSAALLTPESELPTPLAHAAMRVSSSLPSAIALISSAIFRCFSSMLPVITCEEALLNFGSVSEDKTEMKSLKEAYHSSSDHLANGIALCDPLSPFYNDTQYCQARDLQNFLRWQITSMHKSFREAVCYDPRNHRNQVLVQSLLLHSFGTFILRVYTKSLHILLKDRSGIPATIRSRSLNTNVKKWKHPFLLYSKAHTSGNLLLVTDTTVLNPLTVLLFLNNLPKISDNDNEEDIISVRAWADKQVKIILPSRLYLQIQDLRKALRDMRDYFIITEALNVPDDSYELMCGFRENLLDCLKDILLSDLDQSLEKNSSGIKQ